MANKSPVILIYGGESSEHEISCRSAAFLVNNIDPSKFFLLAIGISKSGEWFVQNVDTLRAVDSETLPIDKANPLRQSTGSIFTPGGALLDYVEAECGQGYEPSDICVFPITHGTHGEDGHLQGYLELSGFSFVGPDTLGSAIGMDKHVAKLLVADAGISIVPYTVIRKSDWQKNPDTFLKQTRKALQGELFVKPAALGSSVGITKVTEDNGLKGALDLAFEFDEKVLVEQAMSIREIECAALGGYDPEISRAGEVNATGVFYSYEAKYLDDDGAIIKVPADLSESKEDEVRDLSLQVFKALNLYGFSRIDWFLEKETGKFYFNEVNTLPGMTSISQYPQLWKQSGLEASDLLTKLINTGIERGAMRRSLKRSI